MSKVSEMKIMWREKERKNRKINYLYLEIGQNLLIQQTNINNEQQKMLLF